MPQRTLQIPRAILSDMATHAKKAAPQECCGVLAGTGDRVDAFFPMTNADASDVTYRLLPEEQFRVFETIRKEGRRLIALFHSHPASPPVPSPTDIRRAFFPGTDEPNYPEVAYAIMGLAGPEPETRAFLIEADAVREIEIHVL